MTGTPGMTTNQFGGTTFSRTTTSPGVQPVGGVGSQGQLMTTPPTQGPIMHTAPVHTAPPPGPGPVMGAPTTTDPDAFPAVQPAQRSNFGGPVVVPPSPPSPIGDAPTQQLGAPVLDQPDQ
jgi:hypothetical protein